MRGARGLMQPREVRHSADTQRRAPVRRLDHEHAVAVGHRQPPAPFCVGAHHVAAVRHQHAGDAAVVRARAGRCDCGPRTRARSQAPAGPPCPVPAVSASAEAPAAPSPAAASGQPAAPRPRPCRPLLRRPEHARIAARLEAPHDRRLTPACSSRDSAATAPASDGRYRRHGCHVSSRRCCFQSTEPTRPGPRAQTPARWRRARTNDLSPEPPGTCCPRTHPGAAFQTALGSAERAGNPPGRAQVRQPERARGPIPVSHLRNLPPQHT